MNLRICFIIIALISTHKNVQGLFTYDRVARLMQKGEYDKAKPLLQKMVVDAPENPEVLYDAGFVSYKTKDFKQAAAYFKQATRMPDASNTLKEKAYFNSANTAVELKELESAITDYEHVLEINPGNEQAKHNLQKVKEMLEKQQQEDKQDKKDDKQKDKDEQKKDEQDKKDKDKKEKSDKDKSKDGEQSKQDKSGEQDSQNKENEAAQDDDKKDEKQSQKESQKDDAKGNQDKSQQESNEQKEQQAQHEKSNEEKKSLDDNKSESEKMKEQAAQQAQENKDGKEGLQEQSNQERQQKMAPHLAKILDEQEKKDAALHKMMVKQAVGNNMAGHNGQNNW